ncbi:hypothetical protein ACQ86D_37910 [Streptomyces galilaeus]
MTIVVEHPDLAASTTAMPEGGPRTRLYPPSDRRTCAGADESLLSSCARLPAVRDGSPSSGRDATAHPVAFARSHGIEVEVLRPDGASRTVPEEAS